MHFKRTMAMLLAGGEGQRLSPLTLDRAKPAVPFGGRFRIIDIVLSNFINSKVSRINILTQFKADSMIKHIHRGFNLETKYGRYIDIIPAQMRVSKEWYMGSADAVFQNLHLIKDEGPDYVYVFGADHIYKMDVTQMLGFHSRKRADLTISAIPVPVEQASRFGIIEVDKNMRVIGFEEKPKNPKTIPGKPEYSLVSMGNYIFSSEPLIKVLEEDAQNLHSDKDFGKDIIPAMYKNQRVFAYDFNKNKIPGQSKAEKGYWIDVGTIDAYYEASMDLVSVNPVFNQFNKKWPIFTLNTDNAPTKFVFADKKRKRIGIATDSLVSEGCIISGGTVDKSILSPSVRVNSYSHVENCIIFNNVNIGRHCKLKNTIVDKNVKIPPKTTIGYDLENDKKRFTVTEKGIVVVPKGYIFNK